MFSLLFSSFQALVACFCFFLLHSPSPSHAALINATIDDQDVSKISYLPAIEWDNRPLQGWEDDFYNFSRTFTWTPGANATFVFTGSGIWAQGPFAPDQARRRIFLDGYDQGVYNALAPERSKAVPFWSRDDLRYTTHTLVIVHEDTRDKILALDAFIVQFDEDRDPFPYSTTTVTSYAPTVTVMTDGSGNVISTTLGVQPGGSVVPDPVNSSLTSSRKSYTAIILGIVLPIVALFFCCGIALCCYRRRRTTHRQRRRASFRQRMFSRFGGAGRSIELDSSGSSRMYATAFTSAGGTSPVGGGYGPSGGSGSGGGRGGADVRSITGFTIASTHYSTAEDHFLASPRTPRSLSPVSPVPFSGGSLGLYDTNTGDDEQAHHMSHINQMNRSHTAVPDHGETADDRRNRGRAFDGRHSTAMTQTVGQLPQQPQPFTSTSTFVGSPHVHAKFDEFDHAGAGAGAAAGGNNNRGGGGGANTPDLLLLNGRATNSQVTNYSLPRSHTRTFEPPAEWESMPSMAATAATDTGIPNSPISNASSGPPSSSLWRSFNSTIGNGLLNGNRDKDKDRVPNMSGRMSMNRNNSSGIGNGIMGKSHGLGNSASPVSPLPAGAWDSEINRELRRDGQQTNSRNQSSIVGGAGAGAGNVAAAAPTRRRPSTVFSETDSSFSHGPGLEENANARRQGRNNVDNNSNGSLGRNNNSNRNSQGTGPGSVFRRFSQIITSPFNRPSSRLMSGGGQQQYNYNDSNRTSMNMQGLFEGTIAGRGGSSSDERHNPNNRPSTNEENDPTYFRGMRQFNSLGIPLNYYPAASRKTSPSGSGTASPVVRRPTMDTRRRSGGPGSEDFAFSSYTKQTRDQVISSATMGTMVDEVGTESERRTGTGTGTGTRTGTEEGEEEEEGEEDEKEKIVENLDGSTVDGGDLRTWSIGHDTVLSRGTANSPTQESAGTGTGTGANSAIGLSMARRPSARSSDDDYDRHANPPPSYSVYIPPDTKMPTPP